MSSPGRKDAYRADAAHSKDGPRAISAGITAEYDTIDEISASWQTIQKHHPDMLPDAANLSEQYSEAVETANKTAESLETMNKWIEENRRAIEAQMLGSDDIPLTPDEEEAAKLALQMLEHPNILDYVNEQRPLLRCFESWQDRIQLLGELETRTENQSRWVNKLRQTMPSIEKKFEEWRGHLKTQSEKIDVTVSGLKQENQNLQSENRRLKQEVDELTLQVTQLQLAKDTAVLNTAQTTLRVDQIALAADQKALSEQTAQSVKERETLMGELRKQLDDSKRDHKSTSAKLKVANGQLLLAQKEFHELRDDKANVDGNVTSLRQELTEANRQNVGLAQDVARLNGELGASRQKGTTAVAVNTILRNALSQAGQNMLQYTGEIADLREEINQLDRYNAEWQTENWTVAVANASLHIDVERMNGTVTAKDDEIDRLGHDLAVAEDQKTTLAAEKATLENNLREANWRGAESDDQNEVLRLQNLQRRVISALYQCGIDRMTRRQAESDSQILRLNGEVQKTAAEATASGQEVIRLQGVLKEAGTKSAETIKGLKDRIAALSQERDTAKAGETSLESDLRDAYRQKTDDDQTIDRLTSERDQIKLQKEQSCEAVARLMGERDGLKLQKEQSDQAVLRLTGERDAVKLQKEKSEKESDALKTQLDDAAAASKAKIDSLESQNVSKDTTITDCQNQSQLYLDILAAVSDVPVEQMRTGLVPMGQLIPTQSGCINTGATQWLSAIVNLTAPSRATPLSVLQMVVQNSGFLLDDIHSVALWLEKSPSTKAVDLLISLINQKVSNASQKLNNVETLVVLRSFELVVRCSVNRATSISIQGTWNLLKPILATPPSALFATSLQNWLDNELRGISSDLTQTILTSAEQKGCSMALGGYILAWDAANKGFILIEQNGSMNWIRTLSTELEEDSTRVTVHDFPVGGQTVINFQDPEALRRDLFHTVDMKYFRLSIDESPKSFRCM